MSQKPSNDGAVTSSAETQGNTARNGNVAIQQEFDRATETNTVAAWELFLARHPGHPLTVEASERLRLARAVEK